MLMLLCGDPTETVQMSVSFCIKFQERAKFITHGAIFCLIIKYLKVSHYWHSQFDFFILQVL
jgi:hypothetical protein